MNLPCKDCLIIPVCRHKHYLILVGQCFKLDNYLYNHDRVEDFRAIELQVKLMLLEETLTPHRWTGKSIYERSNIFERGRRAEWVDSLDPHADNV